MLVGRYLKTLFFSAARFFSAPPPAVKEIFSSDDEDDLFSPCCGLKVEVVVGHVFDQEEKEFASCVVSGVPSVANEEEEVVSCAVSPVSSAGVEEEVVVCAVSGVPPAAIEESSVSRVSSSPVGDEELSYGADVEVSALAAENEFSVCCVSAGGASGPSLANSGYSAIFSDSEDDEDEKIEVSMVDSSPGTSLKRGYSAIFSDSEEEDEDEAEIESRFVEFRKNLEAPCDKKQRVKEPPLSQYVLTHEMTKFAPPPIPSSTPPIRFIRARHLAHPTRSSKPFIRRVKFGRCIKSKKSNRYTPY